LRCATSQDCGAGRNWQNGCHLRSPDNNRSLKVRVPGDVTQLCKINDLQEDEGSEHRIAPIKEFSVLPSSSLCRLGGTAELQVQS
jgi:hypothetical protein